MITHGKLYNLIADYYFKVQGIDLSDVVGFHKTNYYWVDGEGYVSTTNNIYLPMRQNPLPKPEPTHGLKKFLNGDESEVYEEFVPLSTSKEFSEKLISGITLFEYYIETN